MVTASYRAGYRAGYSWSLCLASQSCSQMVLRAVATSGRLLGAPWPILGPRPACRTYKNIYKSAKNIYCCYYCELLLHLDDGNVPVGLGLEHLLLTHLVITRAPVPWRCIVSQIFFTNIFLLAHLVPTMMGRMLSMQASPAWAPAARVRWISAGSSSHVPRSVKLRGKKKHYLRT